MNRKTITIEIPKGIYKKHYGNLDLVLALRNSKIDEKSIKKIEGLFEKWKGR